MVNSWVLRSICSGYILWIYIKYQTSYYRRNSRWDPPGKQPPWAVDYSQAKSADRFKQLSTESPFRFTSKISCTQGLSCESLPCRSILQTNGYVSTCHISSTALNPTREQTCIQRVAEAKEMKAVLDELMTARKNRPNDPKTKWYYYDQSSFQQRCPEREMLVWARNTLKYTTRKGLVCASHPWPCTWW